MQKSFDSVQSSTLVGGARRLVFLAMATVFTVALVASLAWGLYGIARP